jgi:UDP-N-acetylglucosamine acyltransferase
MIHPTAIVAPEAKLGADVSIGAYAIVEAGAVLGDGCVLHSHAIVRGGTELGSRCSVHSFAVIGDTPQDLKFDPATPSGVRVGPGSVLREGVTIHRSTKPGGSTVLGEACFLMAYSHVAHDCRLGDRVVLANGVLLAGHITVGDNVFIGGGAGVHQFVRIGEGIMLGGHASISFDLPPFTMVADRNRVAGLNVIGLRRRGCPRETIAELKMLFHRVYAARNPRTEAAAALAAGAAQTPEGRRFLEFFGGGKRGIARPRRAGAAADDAEAVS